MSIVDINSEHNNGAGHQPGNYPGAYPVNYYPVNYYSRQPLPSAWQGAQKKGVSVTLFVICVVVTAVVCFAGGYFVSLIWPFPVPGSGQQTIQKPGIAPPSDELRNIPEWATSTPEIVIKKEPSVPAKGKPMTASEVAAAVRESVVEITTEIVTTGGWRGSSYISEGAGSGVIISDDGYIITNDHVIEGASNITVRLSDGRDFPAKLVGTDRTTDIAVLKIAQSGLTPATFGNSSALIVGESALAVGNPLGELGGTVTGGIISALDRDIYVNDEIMTLLQTDAAVNPGNSGGGLFNMSAELIGVINAKSSGLNLEGLGFAIPSNTARAVAGDIIMYGYVRGRADIGLEVVDIQTSMAARYYRVEQAGVYIISSVDSRLKNGDRITAIDERPVENLLDYYIAMKGRVAGDTIDVTVVRGGSESITIDITLTEWKPA